MSLHIFIVTTDGSILEAENLDDALCNSVPDYYIMGNDNRIWCHSIFSGETIHDFVWDINQIIELTEYYANKNILICPATKLLWEKIHTNYGDASYCILKSGRADLKIWEEIKNDA